MAWFDRILVPLDGSQLAEIALDRALDLARQFKSKLILLQVVSLNEGAITASASIDPGDLIDPLVENEVEHGQAVGREADEYLGAIRNRLAAEGIDATVETDVGEPAERILGCANATGASLIVMSTHGHGGLKRRAMGGTASAVVQQAALPVLVIPYR